MSRACAMRSPDWRRRLDPVRPWLGLRCAFLGSAARRCSAMCPAPRSISVISVRRRPRCRASVTLLVGHSLGFLWLARQSALKHLPLVGINAFPRFLEADDYRPAVAARVLERMRRRVVGDTRSVLEDFWTRAGAAGPDRRAERRRAGRGARPSGGLGRARKSGGARKSHALDRRQGGCHRSRRNDRDGVQRFRDRRGCPAAMPCRTRTRRRSRG